MSEMRVSISDAASGKDVSINSSGALSITQFPANAAFFGVSQNDLPGVVASNNFASLLNPVGSGKRVLLVSALVTSYASGATTTDKSMTATRISAHSAGTDSTSTIVAYSTGVASIAQFRTNNPTVTTVGSPFVGCAPAVTSSGGSGAALTNVAPNGAAFILAPGEGIVLNTSAGDVDQRWCFSFVWGELV